MASLGSASLTRASRTLGVLILAQMAGSGLLNFAVEAPLIQPPGFLANAASHAQQLGAAALLGMAVESLWLASAVVAYPIIVRRSPHLAVLSVAIGAVVVAVAVQEMAAMLTMRSLSEAFATADAAGRAQVQVAATVASAARNWTHFLARMLNGAAILGLCAALYRGRLIPRVLAGAGCAAALVQIATLARPLFGGRVLFPLLAPVALTQVCLAGWLLVRGLQDPDAAGAAASPAPAE